MKTCRACQTSKSLSEFNKDKTRKDGHSATCRACMKIARKKHYNANKAKVYREVKTRRKQLTNKLWAYKCEHPCVDCGESNPIVLEFDHLSDKVYNVSYMVSRGLSWKSILAEIEKCEVVCANCHRIRTHTRGGWVRDMIIEADVLRV